MLNSCARITSPQGGPEDMEPPKLLSSTPESGSTMFQSTVITLTFDERVKLENIQGNLLITPRIDNPYQTKVKKNKITITFDDAFQENTTYTFAFGGSITDITNNNAARNLNISFSTGPVIDSLEIEGQIKNLYSQEPVEEALVALYDSQDTLNVLTGRASYYAYTDTAGVYKFRNLPSRKYVVYGVIDNNNNNIADSDKETYGFYPDTLLLDQNLDNIDFTLQKLNVDSLRVRNSRSFGPYFETTFNKPIISFVPESSNQFYYQRIEPNKIRYYRQNAGLEDTISVSFQAVDSLGLSLRDTTQIVFKSSDVDKDPFNVVIQPEKVKGTDTISFEFSKPLLTFLADSLFILQDSSTVYLFQDTDFRLNEERTQLTATKSINEYVNNIDQISIEGGKMAFISVDRDTSNVVSKRYGKTNNENTAVISGNINSQSAVIVQLLNARSYQVIASATEKSFTFAQLAAGQYKIRVIQDLNGNKNWDIGNILLFQPPEPVRFYFDNFYNTDIIEVRDNWEVDDVNVNF